MNKDLFWEIIKKENIKEILFSYSFEEIYRYNEILCEYCVCLQNALRPLLHYSEERLLSYVCLIIQKGKQEYEEILRYKKITEEQGLDNSFFLSGVDVLIQKRLYGLVAGSIPAWSA